MASVPLALRRQARRADGLRGHERAPATTTPLSMTRTSPSRWPSSTGSATTAGATTVSTSGRVSRSIDDAPRRGDELEPLVREGNRRGRVGPAGIDHLAPGVLVEAPVGEVARDRWLRRPRVGAAEHDRVERRSRPAAPPPPRTSRRRRCGPSSRRRARGSAPGGRSRCGACGRRRSTRCAAARAGARAAPSSPPSRARGRRAPRRRGRARRARPAARSGSRRAPARRAFAFMSPTNSATLPFPTWAARANAASLALWMSAAASRSRTVIRSPASRKMVDSPTVEERAEIFTTSSGLACSSVTIAVMSFVMLAIGTAVFSFSPRGPRRTSRSPRDRRSASTCGGGAAEAGDAAAASAAVAARRVSRRRTEPNCTPPTIAA